MIVIAGVFEVIEEKLEEATVACIAMQNETMKEEGCISYRFYADLADKSYIHIFEEWESDAHLKAHFETAHMAEFRKVMAVSRTDNGWIKRYVVSEVSEL